MLVCYTQVWLRPRVQDSGGEGARCKIFTAADTLDVAMPGGMKTISPLLVEEFLGLLCFSAKFCYQNLCQSLAFRACISFLRCSRKGNVRKCWQFPISFTGVYLVFELFQTRVVHFCSCLVRMTMPLLSCRSVLVLRLDQMGWKNCYRSEIQGQNFIHPPTPEKTLLGVGGV